MITPLFSVCTCTFSLSPLSRLSTSHSPERQNVAILTASSDVNAREVVLETTDACRGSDSAIMSFDWQAEPKVQGLFVYSSMAQNLSVGLIA